MKNSEVVTTRMSPCLRIFIESLLDEANGEFVLDELFVSDGRLAISAGLASTAPLEPDKKYKWPSRRNCDESN